MTRRKLADRDVRKVSVRGASYSVTLPIEEIRKLRWRAGQKVTITRRGSELIIKDWKK
ncbi:MAG TPA: AbrB/MazE/SpoVT family DNA-binding domain-containing protein [Candidatus Paceibacterota bacterium]|nr:AbrB/MazE/SpoVT family DNA-binding domain-containing protein [Candidatus Paceibacterota bacterium]